MRLVAVSDTHLFETELDPVPEGDVFVHAGDLLRKGTLDELGPVARWLQALPHRHKIVVAGNHDWCFVREPERARRALGEGIVYLEDQAADVEGLRFWGSPWQPEYNAWAFNLPRGRPLEERWALIPERTDVLVTHCPPRGLGDRAPVGGRSGCEALLAAALRIKPALHLFGHIHQDGGLWHEGGVSFANVTTWECEREPTVIDIDPVTRFVTPVSVPPARRGASGL